MTCYSPVKAFVESFNPDTGKKVINFTGYSKKKGRLPDSSILYLPCGHCIGCVLQRSKETALRAVHEAQQFYFNTFITLTVEDGCMEEVFPRGNLEHRPFQLFMKRLREYTQGFEYIERPSWFNRKGWNPRPIRALMCGEYGSLNLRPHYHSCLFNFDFKDKVFWAIRDGHVLYRSPTLERLWPYGFSTIGDLSFNVAAYVARYTVKKNGVDGDFQEFRDVDGMYHFMRTGEEYNYDPLTGEIRKSPYIVHPYGYGLGRFWIEKYGRDTYKDDFIVERGFKYRPPHYYDKIFDSKYPEEMARIKEEREAQAKQAMAKFDSCEAYFEDLRAKFWNAKSKFDMMNYRDL